jgi:transcriptional coactivator HFI1/ADA1
MIESQGLGVNNYLDEYHQAKQIRLPDLVPASAGGLNKTSK